LGFSTGERQIPFIVSLRVLGAVRLGASDTRFPALRAARAARARSEEKKRKRDEKTALRKAQRAEVEPPTDETNPRLDEKQS